MEDARKTSSDVRTEWSGSMPAARVRKAIRTAILDELGLTYVGGLQIAISVSADQSVTFAITQEHNAR